MNTLYAGVLTAIAAYLIGSFDFAIIVCRLLKKDDIRNYGSGNAGMTNVLRTYGVFPAVLTFIGDLGKGVAAIFSGGWIFSKFGIGIMDGEYIAGLFVLLGHIFPLYFGFRGGKGVLTTLGIMFMIDYKVFIIVFVIMIISILLTRMMSVGSIIGAILFPIVTGMTLFFRDEPVIWDVIFAALFGAVVIFMHRENIKKIFNGTERKIWLTRKEKLKKDNKIS